MVGVPDSENSIHTFTHFFSGGLPKRCDTRFTAGKYGFMRNWWANAVGDIGHIGYWHTALSTTIGFSGKGQL